MINIEAMQEIGRLSELYEQRWGKEVDYLGLPVNMSQEKLLQVLQIIVNTGESVLSGYKRIQ